VPSAVPEEEAIVAPTGTTLKDSERALILRTLEAVRWVIGGPKGAAAKLGLKRTTLIHKMKKLGIARPGTESTEGPALPLHEDSSLIPSSDSIPN